MRMTGVTGLAIVMALLMVNLAFADSCEEYCDPGWYLVVGGLTGFEQFQDTEDADIGTTLGFELRGGYRVLKYFAAEGEFDFLSGFTLRTGDPDVGDLKVDGPDESADVIRRVLDGGKGPQRDIVVLNAAGALMLTETGATDDWAPAIKAAGASIDEGRAKAALEKLVEVSNADA